MQGKINRVREGQMRDNNTWPMEIWNSRHSRIQTHALSEQTLILLLASAVSKQNCNVDTARRWRRAFPRVFLHFWWCLLCTQPGVNWLTVFELTTASVICFWGSIRGFVSSELKLKLFFKNIIFGYSQSF